MRYREMIALRLAFVAPVALAGCVSLPPIAAPIQAPNVDALAFFEGHTEGRGKLRIMIKGTQAVAVRGRGHREGDTLVLDQIVDRPGKPPQHREWRIRQDGPGRYAGTLTGTRGGIVGDVHGDQLHLAFRTKSGMDAQQWLIIAPDGRSAHNIMVVKKLGMRVAVLDETIRKIG